jgi:hypothetical protein
MKKSILGGLFGKSEEAREKLVDAVAKVVVEADKTLTKAGDDIHELAIKAEKRVGRIAARAERLAERADQFFIRVDQKVYDLSKPATAEKPAAAPAAEKDDTTIEKKKKAVKKSTKKADLKLPKK